MSNNSFSEQNGLFTPFINVDFDNNEFTMKGKLLTTNLEYFTKLFELIKDIKKLKINIYLEYINSSSSVQLLRLFKKHNNIFVINWYVEQDDEIMEERALFIKTIINSERPNIMYNIIK